MVQPLILKHYFNAGFVYIQNLFDNEDVSLSLVTKEKRNVETNFIECASLKKAIYKERFKDLQRQKKWNQNKCGPGIPSHIHIFFTNKKGCKDIYNELLKEKREPITYLHVYIKCFIFNNKDWNKICDKL